MMSNKYKCTLLATVLLLMAGVAKAQDVVDSLGTEPRPDTTVVDSIVVDTTEAKVVVADSVLMNSTPGDSMVVDSVPQDSVPQDSLHKSRRMKRGKRRSYAEQRGMITRDAMKTVFIPKGQWMVGGQVAWNQWNNDNLNYLVLKDINFEGYTFSAGPYLGYFFRNNLAAGARFSYQRYYLNLGEMDLNLGEDLNISLKDLYYLQHNYETSVFLRSYLPIGKSKIFGLFGEVQLNYTFSEGRNTTGKDDTFTAVYEKAHSLELGLGGGMTVFLTDYMAAEVMLNVGGYRFKWGDQNTNNIEQGKLNSSGANFRINLFSIKFGVTYYL